MEGGEKRLLADLQDRLIDPLRGVPDAKRRHGRRHSGPAGLVVEDAAGGLEQGLGLIAPRVLVCAGHQANLAVRLILGEETP